MDDGLKQVPISGRCAPALASLRTVFEENFTGGVELGAAFAVVRCGAPRPEVLLALHGGWTSADTSTPWAPDTLVNVYSTSKGVTALVLAGLVEEGRLDLDAPVTDYWPAFGAAGKGACTVAQLLSHQGGLAGLRDAVAVEDFYDQAGLAARLAAAQPLWPPGTAMGYHPIMWGTLAQQLCLAVSGETVGARLARLVERCGAQFPKAFDEGSDEGFEESTGVGPDTGCDVHLGLPPAEHARCAVINGPNRPWRAVAGITDAEPLSREASAFDAIVDGNPVIRPFGDVGSAPWREAELPAANVHATALGLAALFAHALVEGGDGLARARRQVVGPEEPDLVLTGRRFRRSAAGFMLNHEGCYGPNADAFGHDGAGGSFAFADPQAGIAVAYVMNQMQVHREADRRGRRLVDALYGAIAGALS